MESLISQVLALLLFFLLVGGGFLVSLCFLGVASKTPNTKTRLGLVAISLFVLATQVTCMDKASNFGGHSSTAYSSPIFGWLFIIICLWSIYLTRNTSIIMIFRRGLLWVYENIIIIIKALYNYTRKLIYKLNEENHKRYNKMSSQNMTGNNELPNKKR